MKRILVTGAGGSPAANFVRSLRLSSEKVFIVGTDCDKYNLQRSETDASYLSPECDNRNYINFLNYLIRKHELEFLHIQNDKEISVISENRERLEIKTYLPSKETVRICQNKFASYERWQNGGIKVPRTIKVGDVGDLKKAYKSFKNKIWIREISGAGGKGSLAPKDFGQACSWIDFHQGWGKFLAAELLSPNSVTWMSIWKAGKLIVAQGRKRLYWELAKISPSGITGVTGAGLTIADKKLDKIALASILAIDPKPQGIFSVDLTYDFSGIPNPTEINIGRFFTTHEFFTRAGLNMPEIFIRVAYGEKLPYIKRRVNPLKNGFVWVRGVDFLPILTTENKIEIQVKELKKIIGKINVT